MGIKLETLKRERHARDDGWLAELFSKGELKEFECTHSYMVSLEKGAVRAKHYHNNKQEVIACVHGEVEIILEDISTKEISSKKLSADAGEFEMIIIPPKKAHAVKNIADSTSKVVVFADASGVGDTVVYDFGGRI